MGSWYERLMSLDLRKRPSANFVLERVFVCGPHFVGKSRILQRLSDEYRESNVASLNYKSLVHNHSNEYIENYLRLRVDNKVYEHSILQFSITGLINELFPGNQELADLTITDQQMREFVARCRELTPERLKTDKNLIIIIDTTSTFFDEFAEFLPFLRLQVIAYLTLIPNFSHVAKIVIAFDEARKDSTLTRYGIYDLLYDYIASTPVYRHVRLVQPERFDSVVALTIMSMHKHETLDIDYLV